MLCLLLGVCVFLFFLFCHFLLVFNLFFLFLKKKKKKKKKKNKGKEKRKKISHYYIVYHKSLSRPPLAQSRIIALTF